MESERYSWRRAAIRMAADVAKEKDVIIRLERDGSITVSPADISATDALREFIASKTDPEIF